MSRIYVYAPRAIANLIVTDDNIPGESAYMDSITRTSHRRFYVPHFVARNLHVLGGAHINRVRMLPPGK